MSALKDYIQMNRERIDNDPVLSKLDDNIKNLLSQAYCEGFVDGETFIASKKYNGLYDIDSILV